MADFLTNHADLQPKTLAVIEDRPDGTTIRWTYAELERRSNRLGHALAGLGVGRGTKVVWCGQNSPGWPDRQRGPARSAPRGAAQLPAVRRGAAYVTDHCDHGGLRRRRVRSDVPAHSGPSTQSAHIIVFTAPLRGHVEREVITEGLPTPAARDGRGRRPMIYTSDDRKADGRVRSGSRRPTQLMAMPR